MRETDPHRVTICGSDVHYWIYNDDKPHTIIMVHGFRGTHHGLHDIIRMLPDYRIVIPDLPGFGLSTPMTTCRHDIEGYSDFVRQFVIQLAVTSPPTLLGHSFGSIITAKVAADWPDLFDKLILINPIASPALKGPKKFLSLGAKLFYQAGAALPERPGRALLGNKLMVQATSSILAKTKDKKLRADIHRHHLQHFSSFQTRDSLLESFNASISHTATEYANRITLPTLLIAGADDNIAPLKAQHQLQQALPRVQFVVIEHVGHLIHREAPKEAAGAITAFVG